MIYKDTANDVEKRFDTSNYEVERSLTIDKNKKLIGLTNNKLCEEIMTELVDLRPKAFSYLIDGCVVDKKAKGIKNCIIKKRLKFRDYKKCQQKNSKTECIYGKS